MLTKKIELEKLYRILKFKEEEINIENEEQFLCELKRKGTRPFIDYNKHLFKRKDYKIFKDFKQNSDKTARKPDKPYSIVIRNTEDYVRKINLILNNTSKFRKIKNNQTDEIKRKSIKQ